MEQSEKKKRQGRGCHAVPRIRSLMESPDKWFPITSEDDYHFPGIFHTPFPQRMAYCSDITALPHHDSANEHFLFTDIQFGKEKARNPQKIRMSIAGKEEDLVYRIVPCGGVKYCGRREEGCTYVTSTRESRKCPIHSETSLIRSGHCSVDFVYIWPSDSTDKRRWITGL